MVYARPMMFRYSSVQGSNSPPIIADTLGKYNCFTLGLSNLSNDVKSTPS